jgi:riboflavin kinase/FMN adenylyltransferase
MEPEDFICRILIDKLHAKYVVVGTDYRFGKDRAGDAAMLVEVGEELGFTTIIVEKEKYQDKEISSTYIREELKVGHMETVNVLLNRPFNVTGVVSIGNQLGRKLDFPTINIYPTEYKLLPPNGVYATQTTIDGEKFYGVTNLGTKPTVSDAPEISVETFLFDFDKDVYGKKVDVEFIHFIRPEMKFEDVEGLKRQIAADSDFARNMFWTRSFGKWQLVMNGAKGFCDVFSTEYMEKQFSFVSPELYRKYTVAYSTGLKWGTFGAGVNLRTFDFRIFLVSCKL